MAGHAGGQPRPQYQQYTSPPLTVQQIQQLQQLQAQQQHQLQMRAQGQQYRPPAQQRGVPSLHINYIMSYASSQRHCLPAFIERCHTLVYDTYADTHEPLMSFGTEDCMTGCRLHLKSQCKGFL